MYQRWQDLTYLHWPYEPAVVGARLPPRLDVDTYDGRAWLGLIPFQMRGLRLRSLPEIPSTGSFVEANVRTYVVGSDGRRGVYFFSLDAGSRLGVAAARVAYSLPYYAARGSVVRSGGRVRYESTRRRGKQAHLALTIDVGSPIPPDAEPDLAHFLTARWRLAAASKRRTRWAPVWHPRWRLHAARVLRLDENLVAAAGLPPPAGPPHVLFSEGVDVAVGVPRRLREG